MPADSDLLARPLVAVANPEDAAATADALEPYAPGNLVAVTVVEKGGGIPDKAPMGEVEEDAEEAFDLLADRFENVERDLRYGTDVVEAILAAAREHDATAIVFTPRSGGRFIRFLTGDVALRLVTEADRPVVSLPVGDREDASGTDGEVTTDSGGGTDPSEDV